MAEENIYKEMYLCLFNEVQNCVEILDKNVNMGIDVLERLKAAHEKVEEMYVSSGE